MYHESIVGGYTSLRVFAQDADVTIALKKEAVTVGDNEKAKLGKSHPVPIILNVIIGRHEYPKTTKRTSNIKNLSF